MKYVFFVCAAALTVLIVSVGRLAAQTTASVTVLTPNGGECLQSGNTWNMQWKLTADLSTLDHLTTYITGVTMDKRPVDLYVSVATDHVFWPVPYVSESAARLVVEVYDKSNHLVAQDSSDAAFSFDASCPSDTTPPSTITNLAAEAVTGKPAAKLTWTAPGNDGSYGTADYYEIAYVAGESAAITETNWTSLPRTLGPKPSIVGTAEVYIIDNLTPCQAYTVAIRSFDLSHNASRLSNTVSAKTVGVGGASCSGGVIVGVSPTPIPAPSASSGPMPSATATPAPSPTPVVAGGSITINDGDIFRASNDYKVYIAKYVGAKKFKRWFVGPQMFNFYKHLGFAKVKVVDPSVAASYTESMLVRQDGDPRVWYVDVPHATAGQAATVRWIQSGDAFLAAGFDWDAVFVINTPERNWYITGTSF